MRKLTLKEIEKMPVLSQSQFDNLIYKQDNIKIWISRMTKEDGMPYNNQVTVEKLQDGCWITVEQYQPKEGD